jgi:VCBS repeat protein
MFLRPLLGLGLGAVACALVLAGCYAQTEPASDVGSTSATLNAHGFTAGKQGQAFFQYSSAKNALGTGFGQQTPTLTFPTGVSGPFTARVSGLSPGTNYWYRVCGNDVGDRPFCNSDLEFTTTVPGAAAAFGSRVVTLGAFALVTADFNGDGLPDLVVLDDGGVVHILLGAGDATFREVGTVDFHGRIVVGDFNRDGKQDLLEGTTSGVEVFPGRGDGTFGAPIGTSASAGDRIVAAVGDFNRDGKPDIAQVVAQPPGLETRDVVQVMLGNGNGTFQPPDQTFVAQGGQDVHWGGLVVGDFNGDGKPDMALSKTNSRCDVTPSACGVSVFLGNGDGTFQSERVYATGTFTETLAGGAFHGGGKLDLVVGTEISARGDHVVVLDGKGDGTFQVGASYPSHDQPVGVTDINGDGKLDFVADAAGSGTEVWLGNGDGTFRSPINAGQCVPGFPFAVIADFNGDSKPDLGCSVRNNPMGTSNTSNVILNATPPPG